MNITEAWREKKIKRGEKCVRKVERYKSESVIKSGGLWLEAGC